MAKFVGRTPPAGRLAGRRVLVTGAASGIGLATCELFQAEGANKTAPVLKDVAMHVAAMKPTVARVEDVDPAKAEEERAKLTAEAKASGKPDNIVSKIVDGKMKVFYRDDAGVLAEQMFAKDDSKSVSQVLAEAGLKVKAFTLWALGG